MHKRKDKIMDRIINIAVDGPSGAGKSTLCKLLAKKYGLIHLDTGALYRAVGSYALSKGKDTKSVLEIEPLLSEINIEVDYKDGKQLTFVNGEDYSERIRFPEVSMAASNVSALPPVRSFLLDIQRQIGKKQSVVLDGRDIGTVVLPDADIKIFMTVDAKERAKRRTAELIEKGFDAKEEDIYNEILLRDKNDSERAAAPLKRADDAIDFINENGIDQSFARLCSIIEEKLK